MPAGHDPSLRQPLHGASRCVELGLQVGDDTGSGVLRCVLDRPRTGDRRSACARSWTRMPPARPVLPATRCAIVASSRSRAAERASSGRRSASMRPRSRPRAARHAAGDRAGHPPGLRSRIALSTVGGVAPARTSRSICSVAKSRMLPNRKSSSRRSVGRVRSRSQSAFPAFIQPAGVMTQSLPPGASFSAAIVRK